MDATHHVRNNAGRLSDETIRQLCSGQVITSLSSVIKELVENAIDASATRIEIHLMQYGIDCISVSDNGIGILQSDHALLGQRHATSKLSSFEDLANVQLNHFGFRGEALHSLATLCRSLTIVTKNDSDPLAWKLHWNADRQIMESSPTARQRGTTVTIDNIFDKIPVRKLEFQKSAQRDVPQVILLLQTFALTYPHVGFSLSNYSSKSKVKTSLFALSPQPGRTGRQILDLLFPEKVTINLLEIDFNLSVESFSLVRAQGWISNPFSLRENETLKNDFFYIADHPCLLPKFSKAIRKIYKELRGTLIKPFVFLNFSFEPTDKIDFNVSPDKRTVIVANEELIINCLCESLLNFLKGVMQETYASSVLEQNSRAHYEQPGKDITNEKNVNLKGSDSNFQKNAVRRDDSRSFSNSTSFLSNKISLSSVPLKPTSLNDFYCTSPISSARSTFLPKNSINEIRNHELPLDFAVECLLPRNSASNSNRTRMSLSVENEDEHACKVSTNEHGSDGRLVETCDEVSLVSGNSTSSITELGAGMSTSSIKRLARLSECDHSEGGLSVAAPRATAVADSFTLAIQKDDFLRMEPLGQFNYGFIIGKLDNHLFILDQHACDEKYRYEQLKNASKNKKWLTQRLLVPKRLNNLTLHEAYLLELYEEKFINLGFRFNFSRQEFSNEDHADSSFLRSAPTIVEWLEKPVLPEVIQLEESDICELVHHFEENPHNDNFKSSKLEAYWASKACRSAIMIGTALSFAEMIQLVRQLAQLDQPWNCPHGRPTLRHLTQIHTSS